MLNTVRRVAVVWDASGCLVHFDWSIHAPVRPPPGGILFRVVKDLSRILEDSAEVMDVNPDENKRRASGESRRKRSGNMDGS